MKAFLNTLYEIAEGVGRARAATALAQLGYYDEARAIMLSK
jgi:hypothetical protein